MSENEADVTSEIELNAAEIANDFSSAVEHFFSSLGQDSSTHPKDIVKQRLFHRFPNFSLPRFDSQSLKQLISNEYKKAAWLNEGKDAFHALFIQGFDKARVGQFVLNRLTRPEEVTELLHWVSDGIEFQPDFDDRKTIATELIALIDALYAYADLYRVGKHEFNGTGELESVDQVLVNPVFQKIYSSMKHSGNSAYERFRQFGSLKHANFMALTDRPEYQVALQNAGVDAAAGIGEYYDLTPDQLLEYVTDLMSQNGQRLTEADIKDLIMQYVVDPLKLNEENSIPEETDQQGKRSRLLELFALVFRFPNHTWKVSQVEREFLENVAVNQPVGTAQERTQREIYRIFDGIYDMEDVVEQLYKDFKHFEHGLLQLTAEVET